MALQIQTASFAPCGALTTASRNLPSAAGVTWDSTDICCTAQLAWNIGGVLQVGAVRGWSPCTRGFVRGGRGGQPRPWWFARGIWDGAPKGTNSKRRSFEDEDPPAHAFLDCLSYADSSSVKQQDMTDIFPPRLLVSTLELPDR